MSNAKMREEFEAWWSSEMNLEVMDLHRCEFPMQKVDFIQPYACHETQRAWLAWQAARASASLCPGHGRPECVSCCWPTAEQSAGYTAVDTGTAAADGYRDGYQRGYADGVKATTPVKTKCKNYGHAGPKCGADDCWLRNE